MTDEEQERILRLALDGDTVTLEELLEDKSFDELLSVLKFSSEVIRLAKEFREKVLAQADASDPHANRRALGEAADMVPSQLLVVLERNGRPRNRKAGPELPDEHRRAVLRILDEKP